MTTQRRQIVQRREFTENRTKALREALEGANVLLKKQACIYATGSIGRLEASNGSDLDVFIVSRKSVGSEIPFSYLDEIRVKAELIKAVEQLGMPKFDGDGKYLVHFQIQDLTDTLGKPNDDASNTLTARLLLTLESRCLLESESYNIIIDDVLKRYWRDYDDYENEYIPAFFCNDILRLWRTFCVNYEARTKKTSEQDKIKRRIKNYKLKHSRMLTCFSAIIHMLDTYISNNTVSPEDAKRMISLTPLERLEDVLSRSSSVKLSEALNRALDCYERFLETTALDDKALKEQFADIEKVKNLTAQANEFGDGVHDVLRHVGGENRFYRLLVV